MEKENNKKRKKHILPFLIAGLIILYVVICIGLYFFEPSYFDYADLASASASFDRYSVYSENINNTMYIKQIDENDIASYEEDNRIKYSDGTVILIAESGTDYSDIENLASGLGGEICGYIACVDFYQIYYNDSSSYDDLIEKCCELEGHDNVITAIPDYFEETPSSDYPSDTYTDDSNDDDLIENSYAFEMINVYEAWEYSDYFGNVNVGLLDGMVDYTNDDIDVVNSNEYDEDDIYSDSFLSSSYHATHVAGIIGAKRDNGIGIDGVCSTAEIYSYNGINNTLSYWTAAMCQMIHYEDVKVINISMGCNTFLLISASKGDENAIEYYNDISSMFETVLKKLIDSGDEFVICAAAGNGANDTQYRDFFGYFGYGDKKILSKLDVFGILDTEEGISNAQYVFYFSNIASEKVRDRIIIVGSVNSDGDYSAFANTGDAVDIVAPGEKIYSTVTDNTYGIMSGTSMATPYVSGTAAMIFAIDDSISGADVKNIIISTATENVTADGYVYPILNAGEAVKLAYENVSIS